MEEAKNKNISLDSMIRVICLEYFNEKDENKK